MARNDDEMVRFRFERTPEEREAYFRKTRETTERKLLEILLSRIPDRKKRTINAMFLEYQFDPAVLTAEVMLMEDGYEDKVEDLVNDCVNSIFVPMMDAIHSEVGSIGDDARDLLLTRLRMACQIKFDREIARIKGTIDKAAGEAQREEVFAPVVEQPEPERVVTIEEEAEAVAPSIQEPGKQPPLALPREDYIQKRKRIIEGAPRPEEVLELNPRQFRKLLRRHSRLAKQAEKDPSKKEELAKVSLAVARYFEGKKVVASGKAAT
jgi:hypothetical protein